MSKEKQIESTDWLTRDIPKEQLEREKQEAIMSADLEMCHTEFATGAGEIYTDYDETASKMFAKGYRKQSEWISVEERLPEFEHWQTIVDVPFPIPTPIKVLCALQTKDGYIIREGTYEINDGLPWFVVKGRVAGFVGITHWMPFPEPPKGGEE